MRELQHIADPYRQLYPPSFSPHDPYYDPSFRLQDEPSSPSVCSSSAQGPAPRFESVPSLPPVFEEAVCTGLALSPRDHSGSLSLHQLLLE